MSDERSTQIDTKTLELFGAEWTVFFVVFRYPTELAAKNAWERAEKRRHDGDLISLYRMIDQEKNWLVVAISETEDQVKPARRLLAQGGARIDPDDFLLETVYARRLRVTLANADAPGGQVMQRARYGRHGARIDPDGRTSPHKRPQG